MSRLADHLREEMAESSDLAAPMWARELVASAQPVLHESPANGVLLRSAFTSEYGLVTARIERARLLSRDDLSDTIDAVYQAIADLLAGSATPYPIRFWNHICHIHEPMGESMDRYMAFNVGRFRAFTRRFGDRQNFDRAIATASGVGCFGSDICIHALCATRPGLAVANPRQVQSFNYSARFGPRPPCFARATLLQLEPRILLIGGTASIRGEESMFVGDLSAQLDETFLNLDALVNNAAAQVSMTAGLAHISDMRIYIPNPDHSDTILNAVRQAMPNATFIQLMQAELCRKELLVEIEGRARF